jgi:beta-fructofuranosidase
MLSLPEHWVWDSWYAFDGEQYHAFYLKAPRSLGDPDLRHQNAFVGHSVSADLTTWTHLPDALHPSATPAFDDRAIWTGSVVRDGAGAWRMYYTGISSAENGLVQRIGLANSPDLITWTRHSGNPIVTADYRWYESRADGASNDEAWRDPWVTRTPDGGWHMLVTARSKDGPSDVRGVVAVATSSDGIVWVVREPISRPGFGFSQLEVMQTVEIDGRHALIFCCGHNEMSEEYRAQGVRTGIFAINLEPGETRVHVRNAYRLTGPDLYAGRLVQRQTDGRWVLLAFLNEDRDGNFVGAISNPLPVRWNLDGNLELEH